MNRIRSCTARTSSRLLVATNYSFVLAGHGNHHVEILLHPGRRQFGLLTHNRFQFSCCLALLRRPSSCCKERSQNQPDFFTLGKRATRRSPPSMPTNFTKMVWPL